MRAATNGRSRLARSASPGSRVAMSVSLRSKYSWCLRLGLFALSFLMSRLNLFQATATSSLCSESQFPPVARRELSPTCSRNDDADMGLMPLPVTS